MRVPLTIIDHIRRAELLYADRIAVVDEPDQPAKSPNVLELKPLVSMLSGLVLASASPWCRTTRRGFSQHSLVSLDLGAYWCLSTSGLLPKK
jgi:hypothetical protein